MYRDYVGRDLSSTMEHQMETKVELGSRNGGLTCAKITPLEANWDNSRENGNSYSILGL